MPLDSPAATAAATTSTAAASRPISSLPHPQQLHHYPSPQQQQQQTLPIRPQNPPLTIPHDPSYPFLYPFASTNRGGSSFARGVRPLPAADHAAGYPPPSLVYSQGVGGIQLDYLNHALNVTRPPAPLQYSPLGPAAPPPVKGPPKASPRSKVSDISGCNDTNTRERSKDDNFCIIRDRKVQLTKDASLYALCRSWLRNGINEEIQPQKKDVMKALPKPSPPSMEASYMSNENEDENDEDEQEENEKPVEEISPEDLLMRHIKRAKRVRARLREERSQRIDRYKARLGLLLNSPGEPSGNDTTAGNSPW
ncbi:uncharacterized protein LOC133303424 [Gastrolobium bilobum]|uniref:uncharacterized protein LOC133303424 n=1 Tax=Gastrolobium bilobum TaxID=150636 RepID=UPI002AB22B99|nr:uncharacterized protein LOC133303424 [Gastrolobium bilobum]